MASITGEKRLKLEIDSKLSDTVMAAMAVRGVCEIANFSSVEVSRLEICLVEILNNIIEHAYSYQTGHTVEVIVTLTPLVMGITISDWGFSIPAKEQAALQGITEGVDMPSDYQVNGRGLFIVKHLMDSVGYSSEAGKNSLFMTMNIGKA